MDWDWLKSIAPTAATVLGGPLAGIAVEAIGKALSIDEPTIEKVQEALNPENITADKLILLRQIDSDLKYKMKELGIRLEEIHSADRSSAREMAAKTGDTITPRILALVVLVTWGLIQYHLLTDVIDASMRELVARVLGTLDAALMAVLYYYYGSSSGSAAKNELLKRND